MVSRTQFVCGMSKGKNRTWNREISEKIYLCRNFLWKDRQKDAQGNCLQGGRKGWPGGESRDDAFTK